MLIEEVREVLPAKPQEVGLVYATSLAGLLFIIGIVTRSVWFLRKFGGLLIAIGIGLYIILPLIYVLSWYTIDKSTATYSDLEIDLPKADANLKDAIGSIAVSGFEPNIDSLFTQYNDEGKTIKIGILDALGRAYLSNIVIPLLALFTTIGFVRQFSPMIGGDVEIAGLTRII